MHTSHRGAMIRKINLFTRPVTLLLQREVGHRTYTGTFLTVGMMTILCIVLYGNIWSLILRDNPVTLISWAPNQDDHVIPLQQNNFTLTFASSLTNFAQVYVVKLELVSQTSSQTPNSPLSTPIPLTPCATQINDILPYFHSTSSICIDWDKVGKLQLQGSPDYNNHQFLKFTLEICNPNNYHQNADCILDQSIVEQLSQQDEVEVRITSSFINVLDPPSPNEITGKTQSTLISNQLSKYVDFIMQPQITYADEGYILPEETTIVTLTLNNYIEKIGFNSNIVYQARVFLDNISYVTYRSYPKVQDVLGNLGGLFEILYITCFIIITPLNNLTYKVKILNEIFNFEQPKSTSDRAVHPEDQVSNTQRLQGIFQKAMQLEKIGRKSEVRVDDVKHKTLLIYQIADGIAQFFREQNGKLHLRFYDYFSVLCCSCNKSKKAELIEYSMDKITQNLDIIYIMKKLQEIDKLKMMLLSLDQIKLFDYLPKPKISSLESLQTATQHYSILKPHKSDLEKAMEAQKAYQELAKQSQDKVNQQLFEFIDEDLLKLFQINIAQGVQRNTNLNVTPGLLFEQLPSQNIAQSKSVESESSDSIESAKL